MNERVAFFAEQYRIKTSDELVELDNGTLVDEAQRALDTVLLERGLDQEKRLELKTELRDQLSADAAAVSRLASLGKRLGGQLLDLGAALALFAMVIFVGQFFSRDAGILGLLIAIAYVLFSDAFPNGQSIGKRLMKTAVRVRVSGTACSVGRSFIRNALLLVLGIFDWIFVFGPNRQRLGDMVAGTEVINFSAG